MDDLDFMRFVAMDIITNLAYHGPYRKKSQFFARKLPWDPRKKRLMPLRLFFLTGG